MPFIATLFTLGCFLALWAGLGLIMSTDWERISRALIDLLRSWTTDGLYRRRVSHYRKLVLGDDVTGRESELYLDRRFADRVEHWKRCAKERDEFLAELNRSHAMSAPTCILDGELVDDLTVIGDLTVRLEMLDERHAHLAIYRRGDERNRVAVSLAARRRDGRVVLELIPMEGLGT